MESYFILTRAQQEVEDHCKKMMMEIRLQAEIAQQPYVKILTNIYSICGRKAVFPLTTDVSNPYFNERT